MKICFALFFVVLIDFVLCDDAIELWRKFKVSSRNIKLSLIFNSFVFQIDFNKSYATQFDEEFRFRIFHQNLQTILDHNTMLIEGKSSFKMGINQFGDMTFYEFLKMNEVNESASPSFDDISYTEDSTDLITDEVQTPMEINRKSFTKVKDQKACGSCYAMAAI